MAIYSNDGGKKNNQLKAVTATVTEMEMMTATTTIMKTKVTASVGNLPKGYIFNVPLPRVPRGQSTRQSQVLPNTIPHYYEDVYAIPTYKDTCRIEERVATANSPQWQLIAINT